VGVVVNVRLFAMLREAAGDEAIEIELDADATADDALAALGQRPELAELIARLPVRVAVNREYATGTTPLHPGDEVALIPPVSGGSR
jgi:molybdopterin converting factor subunit 1